MKYSYKKIKGSQLDFTFIFNLNFKMHSCLCFFLVWCLTVAEPSYSQNSSSSNLSGTADLGDSAYTGEEQSQGSEKNGLLSRFLSDPYLRTPADKCEEELKPVCDPSSPYRTYNGTCNNLQNPTWGSVNDCLVRILPASYEGESGMRLAVNGAFLPAPRNLTLNIFPNKNKPVHGVTFLFTTFGQLVAHDQSLSTPPGGEDLLRYPGINCCPVSNPQSPNCAGIVIAPDDPFYSKFNITCLNFLRGNQCNACKNTTGKMQNSNGATAAIDAHIAYGVSKGDADFLRTMEGGKLKARYTENGELLLQNEDPNMLFCPVMETASCFITGDVRVNQHTNLAALQTMLVREHNRLAHNLKIINPHWDDEKLYQMARKILGAKIQAIVYIQYLPVLLGRKYMDEFNLSVKKGGEGTQYNSNLRFGTWNEYTSGTFRVHSMIPTKTGYRREKFRFLYSNNYPILEGNMSKVLKGSCEVPSQQFDHFFVPDVSDMTYKQPNQGYGLDLVAFDIQRGRDHGLPPYAQILNYCSSKNGNITEFDQLSEVMPQKHIELLRQNYNSVQDVDLYVGMQLENTMEGSVLTPTAACVGAGQFYFTKFGDRFYFENVNEAPSFTAAQRESLKQSSIARMICDNNNIDVIQKNPFLFESQTNPNLPCSKLPQVDLNLWKSSK